MIYITQLIFVKEGKEETFHQFEDFALPLMAKYGGQLICRLRPNETTYISGTMERPYEVHFLTFDSEENLAHFLKDDDRQEFMHLKEDAVRTSLLVKGQKM